MDYGAIIGAGIGLAGSLMSNSDNKDNSQRISDKDNIFGLNTSTGKRPDMSLDEFATMMAQKTGKSKWFWMNEKFYNQYMDQNYGTDGVAQIPESVYYSQKMNEYNQKMAREMLERETALNRETYELYQSPEALARQYLAAGINPALAMQNGGAGSVASSSQQSPAGTADMSSIGAEASMYGSSLSARSSIFGSSANFISSLLEQNIQRQGMKADVDKKQAEAEYQNIENKFAYAKLFAQVRHELAQAKDTETRQRYQDILNYITDSSKEDLVMKNHSDAVNSFNQTTLMDDEHHLNLAKIEGQDLQNKLAQANLDWLPQEKAAAIANVYAQARAAGASAAASMAAAENYAADTYGKRFDNKMRDQLHSVIQSSEKSRYESTSTSLDVLKEALRKAKKDNNTYEIRLIGDLIGKISGAVGAAATAIK